MATIIRVYGKADSFDIELSRNGDKWEVDIPPDMTDGVYAVQLTAINNVGERGYWVGELYMVNSSICCLNLSQTQYTMNVKESNDLMFDYGSTKIQLKNTNTFEFDFTKTQDIKLHYRKGCCYDKKYH